jgi:DNA-binding MarR family transcriptional regulator
MPMRGPAPFISPHREPLEALLLYRLSRLVVVAGRMVTRLCEGRFGITRREWRMLVTLASLGELNSSKLAEHAQLDRARTSKAVGSLVAKELISREARAGDRRQVTLALTARGRALYDELFPLVSAINTELGAALDVEEGARFDAALLKLQTRADAMLAGAVLPKVDRARRGVKAQLR